MKNFKLPDWTFQLPNHTNLMSKDIAAIFGYKHVSGLTKGISLGYVPPPDGKVRRGGVVAKSMWSMGYLRKIESEQDDKINGFVSDVQPRDMGNGLEHKSTWGVIEEASRLMDEASIKTTNRMAFLPKDKS